MAMLSFIYNARTDSGVARLLCALAQEIFLRPLSTKITEFEVKNRCKSAEEANVEHLQ